MILVDTSVWIDHFRQRNDVFYDLLLNEQIVTHRFIIGELAMGSLKDRKQILVDISKLPKAVAADDKEVLALVENLRIYARGIGYVDAHLLASARLTASVSLWTRDRRLVEVAEEIGVAANLPGTRRP
jgi:predicted nucleic acid-binding protein